jgi:hypothetical protein
MGEPGEPAAQYIETGHTPVSMSLIKGIQAYQFEPGRRHTPSGIVLLLLIASRFKYFRWKPFNMGDHEIAQLLGVSTKTVQRDRAKLVALGWLKAEPGRIIQVDPQEYRRTRYLGLNCPGFAANGKPAAPWFALERRTFAFLLRAVVSGTIEHRHVVAYLAVRYFMQQRGGGGAFTASKHELRGLFGMPGIPEMVRELSMLLLPDGEPLYRCKVGHRDLQITDLRDYPECKPDVCVH